MDKLITVIIPIYNTGYFLNECIDSVLRQSYNNLEILLIDDGSTDNSPQICDFYAQKDNRVRVLHQVNGGLSAARNTGLNNAHGEYYVFVDSDDYIDERMVEKLYTSITETESDIAICNFQRVTVNGEKINAVNNTKRDKEILSTSKLIDELFQDDNVEYIIAWNKMYKRNIWSELRYPKGLIHEDEMVVHHVFSVCKKAVRIYEELYYYRQVPGSIMNSGRNEKRLDKYSALADRLIFLEKRVKQENIRKLSYQYWYHYLDDYYYFSNINKKSVYIQRMKKSLMFAYPVLVRCGFFTVNDAVGIALFLIAPNVYKRLFYEEGEDRANGTNVDNGHSAKK